VPVDMELFYKQYQRNLIFRQHQGALRDDSTVGKGVCAALSYEWVKQRLNGTYKLTNWTQANPIFAKFAVPADTPIGRKFPKMTEVNLGMRKVQPGMALKQKIADLAANTLGGERIFELLAKKDGHRVCLISSWNGLKGGGIDFAEQIQKHSVRFFQGYGIIGVTGGGGGHAMACQIAGSINRYYDANLGEFSFGSGDEFTEAFSLMWEVAGYKYTDLRLWTMYP